MADPAQLPDFVVIVPTRNRRETVCEMIRNTAELEFPGRMRIIVVDDGSTDGSSQALREIAGDLPVPVLIVRQDWAGAAAARNTGAAQGGSPKDILLFLDDDQFARKDLLLRHADSYAHGADAVLGTIRLDPKAPKSFLSQFHPAGTAEPSPGAVAPSAFDVYSGQVSVRRSVFDAIGGFDETFTQGGAFSAEDCDFGVRLLEQGLLVSNPLAVTLHRNAVLPGQELRRVRSIALGDVLFARKHPHLAPDFFRVQGSATRRARRILIPLAHLPFIPRLAMLSAAAIARMPFHLFPQLYPPAKSLYGAGRRIWYWSHVLRSPGFRRSWLA